MGFGNIVLDLLLLCFLVFGVYYGWHRGAFHILLKGFSGLFSALIPMFFFKSVGAFLKERYIYTFVSKKMSAAMLTLGLDADASAMAESVPDALKGAAGIFGIDLDAMAENAVASGQSAVSEFAARATDAISQMISSVDAYVLLFLLSLVLLKLLATPLNFLLMKIPVVRQINRFAGVLFGILVALILSFLGIKLLGFLDETFSLAFIEVKEAWLSGAFYRFSLLS